MKKTIVFFLAVMLSLLEATAQVTASTTLRVLAIGNSFSEDAVEQYLYNLGQEANVNFIISNAYRGGQGLQSHWNDIQNNNNTFEYRKIVDGTRTNTTGQALSTIVKDESWDIITFQQVSQNSGKPATYEPYLGNLIEYVKGLATNSNLKIGLHQTWAYAQNSTHSGFANYSNDQMTMYNAIIAAVNQAADYHTEIEFVIPSGTAIQNARTTFLGDNFNRDGYHLDLGIGRYTAACTWLEALTGVSPVGMTYRPQSVDALMATVAQNAAHYAILAPSQVTDMSTVGYSADNVITPSDVVKVNFGETVVTAAGWNSITPNGRVITSLEDVSGNATEITIILNDIFNGTNELGLTSTATVLNMPDDVSKTCLWGYAEGTFGTQSPQSSGGFSFCHLNKDLAYDFTFFGSRKNCNDNRETGYTLTGANTRVGYLDGANNSTNTVTVRGVRPDQNGQITLTVTPGANNTNTNKFYYINAMQIEGYAPTAAIILSSPYTGTALAQGDFYLYNVASGLWLQNNDSRTNFWHTMGDIGKRGIDFTLTANGDGYYICGKQSLKVI